MIPVVTIDGPSGAGKGTICRLVAQEAGYHLLDSGALYRLTALASINQNVDLGDDDAVAKVAQNLDIEFQVNDRGTNVMLAGSDVTTDIRLENVGMAASKVAAVIKVRQALLQRQRDFLMAPGLVADGRDMGTVVFPKASVKVFLTASAEERAQRRVRQLEESGERPDYEKVLQDIQARDEKDRTRTTAPLTPADDALVLDSTQMSIEDVFAAVMQEIQKNINND